MTSTPLQLAAIVSAGVPGLYPVAALPSADDTHDFDSAIIIDSANKRWRVRAPKHPEASVRLEAEHVILQSFTPGLRARLPFLVPTIVGTVTLDGRQAFIYSHIPGKLHDIDELTDIFYSSTPGKPGLVQDLAHAIATIHVFPTTIVEDADLPVYTSQQVRERRLAELDLAVTTGKVPSGLLSRWEQQLTNQDLWDFRTRVIHGDLNEDNLVLEKKKIVEITGWSEVCVGDPAQDFAWLLACEDPSLREKVFEAYRKEMPQEPDRNLEARANLYAEFALAQWLIRGVELDDRVMISEAVSMLNHLEEELTSAGMLRPHTTEQKPEPIE